MFTGSSVALATPMNTDGSIDYPVLEKLLAFHLTEGTQALILVGSTGEGSTITQAEKLTLVKATIKFIQGRMPIIVGVGTNSTATTIEYAQEIAALKPDGLLTICPYYNRPTQEGLFLHFEALSKATTVPVIVYNHPGRTGVDLLPETAARIAKLKHMVGLKEAVTKPERFKQLRVACPKSFLLYSGDDATCIEFIAAGGNGVISVAANIVPGLMQQMAQAALNNDLDAAQKIKAQLMPLFDALNLESNPIPLKWAMAQQAGWNFNNVLRLPLTPLTKGNQEIMAKALAAIKR